MAPSDMATNAKTAINGKHSPDSKAAPSAPAAQVAIQGHTQKARESYSAMEAIWTEKWTLAEAAQKAGKSKEELAIEFAVFGVQAMEALRAKGVYDETLFLAMGINKDGYGPGMDAALEDARSRKGKEAAMRRKNQGLPLTRGNHDDIGGPVNTLAPRVGSNGKNGEKTRVPGEVVAVSGNVQTIFHGQYGGGRRR